jgi:hypothetical protein
MTRKAPYIDKRSGEEIFRSLSGAVQARLQVDADRDPLAQGLLRVVSRFAELVIQRLNRAPQKNREAFLDALNVSRIPPVPACVPLTFAPVKRLPPGKATVWVPARTRVAAPPAEGESEPVVFETTRDVALTNVRLLRVLAHDPEQDLYADKSPLADATPERGGDSFAFAATDPVPHEFYLDYGPLSGDGTVAELRVLVEVQPNPVRRLRPHNLSWCLVGPGGELPLDPASDGTARLTQSGEIVFRELPPWSPSRVANRDGCWLCCRSLERLAAAAAERGGTPPPESASIAVQWEVRDAGVDAAFCNSMPLDLSKDFFPLGDMPRFGDVLYLSSPAFANRGAALALNIRLTNPAGGSPAPLPPVNGEGGARVQWERWDGRRWVELEVRDGTESLTRDGVISFASDAPCPETAVNSRGGCWIRGRLVSGGYGEPGRLEMAPDHTMRQVPATLSPPSIRSVTVSATFRPRRIVTNNNLACEEVSGSLFFRPFQPAASRCPALYLGLRVPEESAPSPAGQQLDLYAHFGPSRERGYAAEVGEERPGMVWQYWNGSDWAQARIEDETESFTVSGVVTVRAGDDIRTRDDFCGEAGLYWLRLLWSSGEFPAPPVLRRLLLNTVAATQTFTIDGELMGSSNGLPGQLFRTARVPVLRELQLEVREPDLPPPDELEEIERTQGEEGVRTLRDPDGNVEQVWVLWREVPSFLASKSRDRHFVVDRQTGAIRFGDGCQGMIPPAGANNVRLRSYRTGGGSAGNRPATVISQLRATIPYVDSVTNLEPSLGGQDFESWQSVRERGARWLRHRDRAVTVEDYQDLARLASPLVAKVKCCPNRDLVADPTGAAAAPGLISLVVVPGSGGGAPLPDPALLRCVRDFLRRRSVPDAGLLVVAPEYVSVSVEAFLSPATPHAAAALLGRCQETLDRYLHPVTGRSDGGGWDFGQLPHESELYALLESNREVDHVASLALRIEEQTPGLLASGLFLIRSGKHRICPAD